jgi:hypothetical protein
MEKRGTSTHVIAGLVPAIQAGPRRQVGADERAPLRLLAKAPSSIRGHSFRAASADKLDRRVKPGDDNWG